MVRYIVLLFASIILIELFVLLQQTRTCASVQPSPIVQKTELDADKLFQLVNDWRTQNGYQSYVKDERLCKIARDRADDGLDNHKGLYRKYGDYPYVIQENSTFDGYPVSEPGALQSWLDSPPHLTTLKKSYKYACIATYKDNAVEIFSNF